MASTRSSSLRALSLLTSLSILGSAVAAPSRLVGRPAEDAPYTKLGCFTDLVNGGRALNDGTTSSPTMTVEACAAFCGTTYQFFGVEYGAECWCGLTQDESSRPSPAEDCSMPCAGDPAETCGAASRIEVYSISAYVPLVKGPATLDGASYLGCWEDDGARVLPAHTTSAPDMTAAKCAANCAGYTFFGTEWSTECYCGNTMPTHKAVSETECGMACGGNPLEYCGGGLRLNVYGFDSAPPAPDVAPIGSFDYLGCQTDAGDRVLAAKTVFDPSTTRASCAAACAGYPYFGVEYGSECYCGLVLSPESEARPEVECGMPCGGDAATTCGAGMRLNVYKDPTATAAKPEVGAFTYQSCWVDSVGGRALTDFTYVGHDVTQELCAATCADYAYFGLEFSGECYCGNTLATGYAAASEAECNMACSGAPTEVCGGPQRITLYAKTVVVPV